VSLLGAPQDAQPLGGLVGLPAGDLQRKLGQGQSIPGGLEVPLAQQPALDPVDLVGGRLPIPAGATAAKEEKSGRLLSLWRSQSPW
jgi:hypothetical protein